VVIQLSPQTEPAYAATSQIIPHEHEAELPQKPDAEKGELGVFAKILASLTGKGAVNKGSPNENLLTKTGAEGQVTEGERSNKSEKAAELGKTAKGKESLAPKKTAATAITEVNESLKNGETETETPLVDHSEHENNVFHTISRLIGQEKDQTTEKGVLISDAIPAHSPEHGRKTEKAEVVVAAQALNELVGNEKQAQTTGAVTAAELTGISKDESKKSRPRQNSGEAIDRSEFAAEKNKTEALSHRIETKKEISGEKELRNRLEEARSRRRAVSFDLRDYRSSSQADLTHREGAVQLRIGAETRVPVDTTREITLELRLPNQGQDSSSAATTWETKASQALENMLARELHQNFNNDIVRHASIALRDGNEGTIRLALKPESLGNVKIHLEMAENKIIGHIVVESEEALRAFEREISSLEKAFRDSGFESANLEMSLAADGRGAEQQWQEMEASRFLPGQIAASRYDAALEQMETPITLDIYQGTRAVNVLV
jgi:flagellar hook-length control protein FliK